MPNWEYKVITSGSLGFASLPLLEQHLNQLGKEEWEIINFVTRPDNPLAFNGLARRPVMRDWVVEKADAAASARPGGIPRPPSDRSVSVPSAEELRAEAEERRESPMGREESLRDIYDDTGRDDDSDDDAQDSNDDQDEPSAPVAAAAVPVVAPATPDFRALDFLDDDEEEDDEDLPTFFEAIRPYMRRNQRSPGMAVGVDFLAKKFEQSESDLIEALKECGFTIPNSPKDAADYLEHDGDLYWLNLNQRGQLWINSREKPRAAFKPVQAKKHAPEEAPAAPASVAPAARPAVAENVEAAAAPAAPEAAAPQAPAAPQPAVATEPLPEGPVLLDRIRPLMRRNRRGPGFSGSVGYMARPLKTDAKTLEVAIVALGLVPPANANDKANNVEIGAYVYWVNRDKGGQLWINGYEKRPDRGPKPAQAPAASDAPVGEAAQNQPQSEEQPAPVEAPASQEASAAPTPVETPVVETAAPVAPVSEPAIASETPAQQPPAPLAAVRLLLKDTKRGSVSGEVKRLAEQMGRGADEFIDTLVAAGLKVPDKSREKPVFAVHAGEIFWFNKNAKGQLWLNAKPSKFADAGEDSSESEDGADEAKTDKKPAAKRPRPTKKKE